MNSPDPARPVSVKQEEPEDQQDLNQCVESRLQVKMTPPDSARDISIKQEGPEDISIKQEEPEDHPHLNILHMVLCKEEVSPKQERSPSLLQEEAEPPHIKEEQEEILLPSGPTLTLLAVKREVDYQDISPRRSQVKVERESHTEDGDDWEETSGEMRAQTPVFSCSECSYALTSQVFLYKHIRRRHNDLYCQMLRSGQITSSACQQVKSVAVTKRGPAQKARRMAFPVNKTHFCKPCNKTFTHLGNLKRHQRLHAGERSYHCTQCDESFNRLSSLDTHERIHTLERNLSIVNGYSELGAARLVKQHQHIHAKGEKHDPL